MMRRFVCVLMTATLCSATALAEGAGTLASATDAGTSLAPAAGLVPLSINVTQPRRVFVRASSNAGLRYVCTTPCRLYVHPGAMDVTLVGWGAHEYHWDVPMHGGAVHLAARLPSGELAPLPPEGESESQMARATMSHQNLALHAGIVIGAVGGAGLAFAHSIAMLETVTLADGSL